MSYGKEDQARQNMLYILLIVLAYTASFFLILINDGVFWDDWNLFGHTPETIFNLFQERGGLLQGFLFAFIYPMKHGVLLGRALTFFSLLLVNVCFFSIVQRIKELEVYDRLLLTIFFGIFPVYFARVSLMANWYTIGYVLFFIAFWVFTLYVRTRNIVLRIMGLSLFFLSFQVESMLVFYVLFILYILYEEKGGHFRQFSSFLFNGIKILLRYSDFVVLPLVYWIVRSFYLASNGLWEGHNAILPTLVLLSPLELIFALQYNIIDVVGNACNLKNAIMAFPFIVFFYAMFQRLHLSYTQKHLWWFWGIGLIAFVLGVFPYLAVSQMPSLIEWSCRFQLLVPVGGAFLVYFTLRIVMNKVNLSYTFQTTIFAVLIAFFISTNCSTYFDFHIDWFKQLSLIENFKTNDLIRQQKTFLFIDEATEYNALKRKNYLFYECTGLMKAAFSDATRLVIPGRYSKDGMDAYAKRKENMIRHVVYNADQYQLTFPLPSEYAVITVTPVRKCEGEQGHIYLRLLFQKMLMPSKFFSEIRRFINLEVVMNTENE